MSSVIDSIHVLHVHNNKTEFFFINHMHFEFTLKNDYEKIT